jgi:hypothetical protein
MTKVNIEMDLTEIRQTAAALFAAHSSEPASETTPSTIGPELMAWCRSLGANAPLYVPVQQDPCGLYGFCSIGVAEKIKIDGGAIRFGWVLWEYPRVFLTAEFHAVWVNPNGEPVDITPKPAGETRIVFAADPTYPPDFDFLKRPNNHRTRIYRSADSAAFVRNRVAGFSPSQRAYETGRAAKKGMELEEWVASRSPADLLPDLVDSFLREADERDALFTPTRIGARCSNPDRAMKLGNSMPKKFGRSKVCFRRDPDTTNRGRCGKLDRTFHLGSVSTSIKIVQTLEDIN